MKHFFGIFKCVIEVINSICAIILLFIICPRIISHENLGFDYMGVIVAILSLLVTVLIGWNIYQVIDLKSYKQKYNELEKDFNSKIEQVRGMTNSNMYYGYAFIDFCQSYVDIGVEVRNYFGSPAKTCVWDSPYPKMSETL